MKRCKIRDDETIISDLLMIVHVSTDIFIVVINDRNIGMSTSFIPFAFADLISADHAVLLSISSQIITTIFSLSFFFLSYKTNFNFNLKTSHMMKILSSYNLLFVEERKATNASSTYFLYQSLLTVFALYLEIILLIGKS